ncbi:MAG: glycosyltransferase, partial [Nitrospirales bacterium]
MKPELGRIDRVRPAVRSGADPASGRDGPGRIKVCLVAVGLGIGGTEGQLLELATRLDPRRFDVLVCSLKEDGVIAQELRARGSRVVSLGGRGAWDLRVPVRLWRLLGRERPDIVHGFLHWANVVVRLAGRLRNVPIIVSSYRNVVGWNNLFHRLMDRVT